MNIGQKVVLGLATVAGLAFPSVVAAAFNLNYDPLRHVLIRAARRPQAVETMDRRGNWKASAFGWTDGVLSVPANVTLYDALLVRIVGDGR